MDEVRALAALAQGWSNTRSNNIGPEEAESMQPASEPNDMII
jgi:hypothetical protein